LNELRLSVRATVKVAPYQNGINVGATLAVALIDMRTFSHSLIHSFILKQPLELNDDFQFALDTLEKTVKNLFITGRAGTGKSTLLHLFKNTTRKKCVVLAPTGVAALNVQGQTIHSFFGFPAKFFGTEEIKKRRDVRLC
jgi:hypothetical protein